ncbi:DUF5301 domain-containing protein [Oribacterium sinus]|uniref:DUF5301 domain-containing protein n=1 Tax=Oribacterium sinus TaxID=237576 RepID=UPI0028E661D5|nr:DUF5301 domain-containing protein [Oribacterium sinus]
MKKYMGIALAFIFIFALTACGAKKEISLPEAKEITEMEITENPSGNTVKITDQDEIAKIVKDIKENTKDTGGESYHEQPANIKKFLAVSFYYNNTEGNWGVVYLYENRNKTYAEQPYSGIWKIKKEVFKEISGKLK